MKIYSQAPCRVDLAGSTLDIWPLYLFHENAVTVNFAVDRYTRARIEPRPDAKITFRSTDLNRDASYDSLDHLLNAKNHALALAAEIVRFFRPEGGFHLETGSEAPAGAGISGSSALIIATTNAFNKWLKTRLLHRKAARNLAEYRSPADQACPPAARIIIRPCMEASAPSNWDAAGIKRVALDVDAEELEARVVLAYTGEPRNSGINNWEVTKSHIDGNVSVFKNFATIATIAAAMRHAIEKHDWTEAARLLREEWSHRSKKRSRYLDSLDRPHDSRSPAAKARWPRKSAEQAAADASCS